MSETSHESPDAEKQQPQVDRDAIAQALQEQGLPLEPENFRVFSDREIVEFVEKLADNLDVDSDKILEAGLQKGDTDEV